jgi:hypothetical protein
MRYSWRKRVAAAILCGMVAVSSVNTSAFAEVTGADAGAALEELAAAAGALTGGTAGEAAAAAAADAEKSNELRQLSFVGSGVRVFKDGVELNSLVEVYEQDEVTLMLVAKQGYALGETATLVTNVEDPIITQFAVEDATVVIPAGTLITDGTLNLTATLTGEPVEEEAAEGETGAESAEAAEDEDLTVNLEDLTNAQVQGTEGDEAEDAEDAESAEDEALDLGGANGLRSTLESSSYDAVAVANGTELLSTSDEITVTQMTVEADVSNPAFEEYAYVEGAVIKVTAAEGAVPGGTRVEARLVEDEKYATAVNEATGERLGTSVAYDITLVDAKGKEVQPEAPVNVAIFDALAGEVEDDALTAVFHVSDDAREVQLVTARQTDAAVQSFDVEHFSIYVVGTENSYQYTPGTGTFADPYITWGKNVTNTVTLKCTNTDENHEHNFWTETGFFSTATQTEPTTSVKSGSSTIAVIPQFSVVEKGYLWGDYYCVIKGTTDGIYTGKPQKLYCGPTDNKAACEQIYVNNRYDDRTVYNKVFRTVLAVHVNTENVKIGAGYIASDLSSRGVTPLFNDFQYSFGSTAIISYLYWYVGAPENYLINYWDTYYIIWVTGYTLLDCYDYTQFPTITYNGATLSHTGGSVALNDDTSGTAASYGYSAYGGANSHWQSGRAQKYLRMKAKAEEPSEEIEASNSVDASVALKPGDTVTFTVDVAPYTLDLTTDQNSSGTVLTKTSTVSVSAQGNEAATDAITTSNEGVARTSKVSDYTTRTIYTSADTSTTHKHNFDYVITRADCIAALKRANSEKGDGKGYNTATSYPLDLTSSVTTDYEAKLKTSGGYLTTTASNTEALGTATATVGKEHYVTYKLAYENRPDNVAEENYPAAIKNVSDVNTQDGGKDNKTPFWEGEVVTFAGYSLGQIVEDEQAQGYWVFSGWVDDQGTAITSDIIMGTQDITVTGQWTYVSHDVVYEMPSWEYDGTTHAPTASYVGTKAHHVDSTPNHYTYYREVTGESGEATWEAIGSDHPVNAGSYKVEATWDYIITNEEKIKENEANNSAGSGNAEKDPEVETPGEGDGDQNTGDENGSESEGDDGLVVTPPATKPSNQSELTVEAYFTISKVDVTLTSPSATKVYDGYPLTASELTMTGNWIESEQAKIDVAIIGTQTLPNNGSGEERTANTIVVFPGLGEDEETEALKLARAEAYASSSLFSAVAEGEGEEDAPELSEEALAFQALLANYNITVKEGTLTVEHRTSANKLPLTVVGATPEALTYNGKDQEVTGFTVNGVASALSDGAQTATFDMDEYTGNAPAEGEEAKPASTKATWTLTGMSATGTGKDASATPYTVELTAGEVAVVDKAGNDVTSEFTWTTKNGSFTIDPVKLTVVSDSASRAYDTTTLTAESYTITEGAFVRGEGFVDNRITWGASQRRVGKVTNTFDISNAWSGSTKQSNYDVTLEYGTLEVLATVDVSERMDVSVSAKSQQVEETGQLLQLSGFTSMVGDYATFTVESGEGTATVYVSGLTAYGSGTTPGKYEVAVTGTPRIWDSMDADKIDVTGCFNLTTYSGYLTIRKEGTNAVEFTNRAELSNKTYDGKSIVPVAEGLQKDTVVFYTLDEAVAAAAANLPGMTDEDGELVNNDAATGTEADATNAGWTRAITELIDAGDYQVWALGFKDGLFTPVETAEVHIKQRAITLVSDSATKAYDGVALTATVTPYVSSTSLGWVAADLAKLEITATGSQKRPGTSKNTIVIAAAGTAAGDFATEEEAAQAKDAVLKNYQVTEQPGDLEVTELLGEDKITLNVAGSTGRSLTYNGETQQVTNFTVNGYASSVNEEDGTTQATVLLRVDGVTVGSWTITGVEALGEGKDVKVQPEDWGEDVPEGEEVPAFDATYPVVVTATSDFKVTDEDGEDVTAQFSAALTNGSFTMVKKSVVIASKSASKTYDLQPLTYEYYRITSGGWATGEGIDDSGIEWTGRRTSPGTSANTFSLDNAWIDGTNPDNYAVTISTGTLTVNHITNDDDKFEVVVKSKSDKQRLDAAGTTVTLSGFESSISVDGKTYIPVRVSRNGFTATLYVTNLRASAKGNARGTYTNKINGTPVVYDGLDPETRSNVTDSIKVDLREGTLRLLGPLDDALVWTNENDVTQLTEDGEVELVSEGIDGRYYSGDEREPVIESKFYSGNGEDGQPLTTIYYTTSKEAADAADKNPGTVTDGAAQAVDGDEDAAEDAAATWSTEVPTFSEAGTHTFYAVGVRDAALDAEGESDSSDGDDRVVDGKRYTEVETFTLTILKRTVTLSTQGAMKTYDGLAIDVPDEVTISTGESGFVDTDRDQLDIYVAEEEFILPGTYRASIVVEEKTAAGEDEGELEDENQGEVATRAAGTGSDAATTGILGNYQIIKNPGQIDIDTRLGDDRFAASFLMPEMTYTWEGSNFYGGKLVAISEYGDLEGQQQTVSEKSPTAGTTMVKTPAYIELENGITYELNGFYAQFTISKAGTYDYSTNDTVKNAVAATGAIYQVTKSVGEDGTVTYERVGSTAVTSSFAPSVEIEPFYVLQGSGNEITSVSSWLDDADNAESSLRSAALEAWYALNEWSTWTYTGTSATTIPAITAVLGVGTTYYALDATEEGEVEELDEDGNVVVAATNTWYTWAQMKNLLVKPGVYTLSFKNTTTNYEPCYAYDALTVHILERTITAEDGAEITVYDPTSSAYGFVWDKTSGNLLNASDKVVANRDGVPTSGSTVAGLPVGPAVIMQQELTYTGEAQQVKPVVVDDQGRLMVEGIHYTLSYEGDITNVGTASVRIISIPGSGYNCDFTASFEIVASEYGSLKAAEKYTYVYAGGNDLAEPGIIANYGDSKVVYSLNGEEYETWAEVVEAMKNVGSYTLAIKTDGTNYVTSEGIVVVEVQPLDMSATPQESVESVEVEAEDLTANTVYVAGGDYSYTGEAYEPEVLIIDTYGNQLVYGRDYTTSVVAVEGRSKAAARAVDEAIDAGSYALAVAYRGNYTGTSYVAFSIDKVAGNEVEGVDVSGVNGGTEGSLEAPTVTTAVEGSNFLYSVDGGAFVSWAEASKLLTAGTHTLAVKATHTNYQDVVSDTFTVTIAARPASDTGTSDAAIGTVAGAAGTGGSTGSSTSGTSSSAGRTVQAAGSTTSSDAVSTTTETPTTEAVTVENLANTAASSTSSSSTTPEAQAAVTHATYMYLTVTIVTGMLLTAAYSLTIIKQRSDEARRLQARAM